MSITRRIVIISMSLAFLILIVTGVIKFPEIQKHFLFIYSYIPASKLSFIHDWSGIALMILIVAHLILKREGLVKAFFGNYKLPENFSKIAHVIIGIFVVLGIAMYARGNVFNINNLTKLSSVEVKDYKGEKLGSINDFRENPIKGPQYIKKNTYNLRITGLVGKEASYSYDEILRLPKYQKVVQLNCVEGWSVKVLWEGVLVKDLLKNLSIKPQAKTIIFYAVDGYSTSFPLDYIMQNNIIMAYKMNNITLPPERGFPFQLVAEQKWGYKWIKWITKIELSSDTNYKGFWESRGYNNNGNVNGSKFSQ
jgi:hypothetical protein